MKDLIVDKSEASPDHKGKWIEAVGTDYHDAKHSIETTDLTPGGLSQSMGGIHEGLPVEMIERIAGALKLSGERPELFPQQLRGP
jgi:hypothetical protein